HLLSWFFLCYFLLFTFCCKIKNIFFSYKKQRKKHYFYCFYCSFHIPSLSFLSMSYCFTFQVVFYFQHKKEKRLNITSFIPSIIYIKTFFIFIRCYFI